ncbi:MAG: hypothetical protein FWE74_00620 [Oscillospiraceae bacterium]|nr:hypothetical protein [Oscillospiraceae bacterium]
MQKGYGENMKFKVKPQWRLYASIALLLYAAAISIIIFFREDLGVFEFLMSLLFIFVGAALIKLSVSISFTLTETALVYEQGIPFTKPLEIPYGNITSFKEKPHNRIEIKFVKKRTFTLSFSPEKNEFIRQLEERIKLNRLLD